MVLNTRQLAGPRAPADVAWAQLYTALIAATKWPSFISKQTSTGTLLDALIPARIYGGLRRDETGPTTNHINPAL